jgi:hypothetical protein
MTQICYNYDYGTTYRQALRINWQIRVRMHDGLTCDIEEGPWYLTADLPRQLGGQAASPPPRDVRTICPGELSSYLLCHVGRQARCTADQRNR